MSEVQEKNVRTNVMLVTPKMASDWLAKKQPQQSKDE